MKIRRKLKKIFSQAILYYRSLRFFKNANQLSDEFNGLADCDIFYINLKHRLDRKSKIEREFKRIGVSHAVRFDAIKNSNGALGCAQSHHALLNCYDVNRKKLLMICEDDCEFTADRLYIDELLKEFVSNQQYDVLCLAYNHRNSMQLNQRLKFTSDTQTTACYILKPHMVSEMLAVAEDSVSRLIQGQPKNKAAIDVVWKKLQKSYVFVLPTKRIARQFASYSDVEKVSVEYGV